ncbi:MAG: sulfite exporter TauE/SafE family protein [Armatimonadetes bacterium]|nr:sulfite exporter TauE/SafE family protein [Armatimonadota bacterium]
MDNLRDLVLAWYGTLSVVFRVVSGQLQPLVDTREASLAGVLLLGVIGATSPCQLSTTAGALAYMGRDLPRRGGRDVLAYAAGKMLMYTIIGVLAIAAGQAMAGAAIPVVRIARRALGPLMILAGLVVLDVVRPRLPMRTGLVARLHSRSAAGGPDGAFALGVAFAFAWCPTLSVLFFGTVIPLALASPWGVAYAPVFALGTLLPLLSLVGVMRAGLYAPARGVQPTGRTARILRAAAGVVFLLAGINDTVLYWFL